MKRQVLYGPRTRTRRIRRHRSEAAELGDWVFTAGLFQQARRGGRDVCVRIDGIPAVVFTEGSVCADESAPRVEVFVAQEPPSDGGRVSFSEDSLYVWVVFEP